jgi:hypothetical protein
LPGRDIDLDRPGAGVEVDAAHDARLVAEVEHDEIAAEEDPALARVPCSRNAMFSFSRMPSESMPTFATEPPGGGP